MKKIIDFKTVSPLYEEEKDGQKWFTLRKRDNGSRFRALHQWNCELTWYIRITNPDTGDFFIRRITNVSYLWVFDASGIVEAGLSSREPWMIIEWGFEEASNES